MAGWNASWFGANWNVNWFGGGGAIPPIIGVYNPRLRLRLYGTSGLVPPSTSGKWFVNWNGTNWFKNWNG